jgi:hypothetical protein
MCLRSLNHEGPHDEHPLHSGVKATIGKIWSCFSCADATKTFSFVYGPIKSYMSLQLAQECQPVQDLKTQRPIGGERSEFQTPHFPTDLLFFSPLCSRLFVSNARNASRAPAPLPAAHPPDKKSQRLPQPPTARMSGAALCAALMELGFDGEDPLDANALEWPFQYEEARPLLAWICSCLRPSNVLSPSHLAQ